MWALDVHDAGEEVPWIVLELVGDEKAGHRVEVGIWKGYHWRGLLLLQEHEPSHCDYGPIRALLRQAQHGGNPHHPISNRQLAYFPLLSLSPALSPWVVEHDLLGKLVVTIFLRCLFEIVQLAIFLFVLRHRSSPGCKCSFDCLLSKACAFHLLILYRNPSLRGHLIDVLLVSFRPAGHGKTAASFKEYSLLVLGVSMKCLIKWLFEAIEAE